MKVVSATRTGTFGNGERRLVTRLALQHASITNVMVTNLLLVLTLGRHTRLGSTQLTVALMFAVTGPVPENNSS